MISSTLKRFPRALIFRSTALAVILSLNAVAEHKVDHGHGGAGRSGQFGAPEIDPKVASAGIVLLIGGVLVLTGRRRAATC
jgi:hypothetical protein